MLTPPLPIVEGIGPRDGSRRGDWFQAARGRRFWPLDPRPEEIDIRDIARSLSRTARWRGFTTKPYWVAQHSVLVSTHCDPADALWGLLHDAAEAYIGDMPRPLKIDPSMAGFREAEARLLAAICDRFGLARDQPPSVKRADNVLLATEARDLLDSIDPEWHGRWVRDAVKLPEAIVPWTCGFAEMMFLQRFESLYSGD